jgi:hypothetical protein
MPKQQQPIGTALPLFNVDRPAWPRWSARFQISSGYELPALAM